MATLSSDEQAQLTDDVKDDTLLRLSKMGYGVTLEAVTGSYDGPTDVLTITIDMSEVYEEGDPLPTDPAVQENIFDVPTLWGGGDRWDTIATSSDYYPLIERSVTRAARELMRFLFLGDPTATPPAGATLIEAELGIPTANKAALLATAEIQAHIAADKVQLDSGGFPVKIYGFPVVFTADTYPRLYYKTQASPNAYATFQNAMS